MLGADIVGQQVEGACLPGEFQRAGLYLKLAGSSLPKQSPGSQLACTTLANYRLQLKRWREERGYEPVRAPVAGSDPDAWATFPGERLDYRGTKPEPLDQSIGNSEHMGGPR